ncbi:ABC transporter family protein [Microthyrium microscopicum]|uniref:ABC transporter family protein n=1 Tax=Microthyrium microscopicum TaxID=703497 RepID=A0A6A6UNA1_9PEZI|nr:ABC transporter family protein [Microthyrium microscopicum]
MAAEGLSATIVTFNKTILEPTNNRQFFCHNYEGWGPFSDGYYDFTPCFVDVPVVAVSLFGIITGAITIWYLLNKQSKQPTPKDWHYYTKLVLVSGIAISTSLQALIQIFAYNDVWIGDFRFWSTFLQVASLGVAFTIHELEHERSRVPSATLLFFWLFYPIVNGIKARSLYIRGVENYQTIFALLVTNLVLSKILFFLEVYIEKKQSPYRKIGDLKEYPSEYANIFSQLSFGWLTPFIKFGYKTYITQEDLWNVPVRNTAGINCDEFSSSWTKQVYKQNPSVWVALLKTYGKRYVCFVPVKLFGDSLAYIQPQLLRLLIEFVESYSGKTPDPVLRGFMIAGGMFAVSLGQSICNNTFMNFAFEIGQNVKSGLISNIYRKSLRLSNSGRASKSTGDIVNLMAVDTLRISEVSRQGHQLWSAPFQIILCMISLVQLLGWVGLAGVGVMAFMVPLNMWIAKLMKKYQKVQMRNKDQRTKITTEILQNMKSIKLYSWTEAFAAKLTHIRNDLELKTLRKIGGTQAASRFCWNATPFFVSCTTFTLYVMFKDKPLSIDLVFPALTLFNLLTMPLQQLPNVITSVVESTVAAGRLTEFFTADEIQLDAVNRQPAAKKIGQESVRVRKAAFSWGSDEGERATLAKIDFTAHKGELNCIVGRVGSGKSSLLQALLGDLHKIRGEVTVCGSIAYVAQNAWIINASVRDNVLFGHHYDAAFYQATIKACALVEDLAVLPDGDRTEVGEKGISLSGGQKARLQLARAVYARADVYLLDDILSAVDQHVGRHIINHVVGPRGLLRHKTRILATNSIPVLKEANHIMLLSEGRIVEHGTYLEAIAKKTAIAALIDTVKSSSDQQADTPVSSASSPTKLSHANSSADASDEDPLSDYDDEKHALRDEKDSRDSTDTLERLSISSITKNKESDEEIALLPVSRQTQTKEKSEQGKVKWDIYMEYARACNGHAVCLWFFAIMCTQSLQVSSSVWLKNWAEVNESSGANPEVVKNVGVYFALGISGSAMLVVQTMIMWLYCSIQASKKLHENMAHAMFRSPMSFFETTPMGRILNRFSTDMFRVDEAIGRSFSELFSNAAKTMFTLGVICVTSPLFICILIPLSVLYLWIQRYYLRTNRELKRLESISRSPIFAHFGESLSGLSTIRAFDQAQRWADENEHRVDNNNKAFFPAIHANRWLGIRLEFVGAMVVFGAATLSIVAVVRGGGPSAGMVGLAMSYALNITQALNWMVRLSVEVETNIVSVERVLEYSRLPSEAEDVIHNNRPAPTWPAKGAIQFNDYSMRYRPGLDLVLKNIALSIKSQEKIGVVGRTGAGKSSLTLSLFRIVEAAEGGIDIDGIDTSTIGLADLRSKLAIIPQDAALFEGTIRDNLDPKHSKSDEELWDALAHARLADHVSKMTNGLDAAVLEGGSNLSQGQKQLVSLARALLTSSSILVLDEATAAVDVETDALLQDTLRSDMFANRTIITIAHRINTIIDCDRIVVLNRGEVKEFGSPHELIASRRLFFELAKEAGLVDADGKR